MTMKKFFLPALCTAALALTGCVGSYNEDDHIATQPEIMKSIAVEGDLADALRITQTSKMKTEQGIEVVCIRGRLKREGFCGFVFSPDTEVNISYKFTWFDAQGKEVEAPAYKWHSLAVKPGGEFAFVSHAPAKDIVNVKLVICQAKPQADMKTVPAAAAPKAAPAAKAAPAQKAPAAKAAPVKTNCLCGCASGNPCYCPEGSACPKAGKK